MLLKVAGKSLWSRRVTAGLCILSIAISVAVLLGINFLREEARASFGRTISGADLIVGARSGQLNLLLYSVFRMGDPTNNMAWSSYREIAANPEVKWAIPMSLGDSHRGFRVVGTNDNYFRHYRYGQDYSLSFRQGHAFESQQEAVVGSRVADVLSYETGREIILAHGTGGTAFAKHENHPFTIVGVLEPTGTPVDEGVYVGLDAIEAIHAGWRAPGDAASSSITAAILGLESRLQTFRVQRMINEYAAEPLQAILPGVALSQLWRLMATVETTLMAIAALVLFAALLGMATMLLASMQERRREFSVLRTVGASPGFIFGLIQLEVVLLTLAGIGAGVGILALVAIVARDWLRERAGVFIQGYGLSADSAVLLGVILCGALVCGLLPAISAYRRSRRVATD